MNAPVQRPASTSDAEKRRRENAGRLATDTAAPEGEVERLCEVMHDAYETAAAAEGWETQERSRKPWADVPEANKATMRAAVRALLAELAETPEACGWCGLRWTGRPDANCKNPEHWAAAPVAVEGVEGVEREEWRSVVTSPDGCVSHHSHASQAAAERFRDWRTAAGRGERNDGMVWTPVEIAIYRRRVSEWSPVEPETTEPEGGESRG